MNPFNGQRVPQIVALAAGLILAGCSKEVVIEATFPEPVVPSLGLNAGMFYTETLQNYGYVEDLPNDIEWRFTLGEANVMMFDSAFGALFTRLVPVTQPGGNGAIFEGLDVIIEPRLDAFEFSLPRQSRSDQYAVWIRYNVAVYEPDGKLITNWPVSAYGQADSRLFGSSGAMRLAAVRAMRDAIANIVIGFPREPAIKAALLPEEDTTDNTPAEELAVAPTNEAEPNPAPENEATSEDTGDDEISDEEVRS